jgi:hypothetical protein
LKRQVCGYGNISGRKTGRDRRIKGHPWFLGCQFHPEFRSKPFKPHPVQEFISIAEKAAGTHTVEKRSKSRKITFGAKPFVFRAWKLIEGREITLRTAERLYEIAKGLSIPFVFKSLV